MPDFAWDGIDGQAYIYYRGSVDEYTFYKEFEGRYDVNPKMTFVKGTWILRAADPNDDPPGWIIPSESEDWGRRLGRLWLRRLSVDDIALINEKLASGRSLRSLMPAELAEERLWYLESLAKAYDDEVLISLERQEFDAGVDAEFLKALSEHYEADIFFVFLRGFGIAPDTELEVRLTSDAEVSQGIQSGVTIQIMRGDEVTNLHFGRRTFEDLRHALSELSARLQGRRSPRRT